MKTITKHFETFSKAESYYLRLCNKFDFVRLVQFPQFSENGMYIFNVK